jgi:hypothetical protein
VWALGLGRAWSGGSSAAQGGPAAAAAEDVVLDSLQAPSTAPAQTWQQQHRQPQQPQPQPQPEQQQQGQFTPPGGNTLGACTGATLLFNIGQQLVQVLPFSLSAAQAPAAGQGEQGVVADALLLVGAAGHLVGVAASQRAPSKLDQLIKVGALKRSPAAQQRLAQAHCGPGPGRCAPPPPGAMHAAAVGACWPAGAGAGFALPASAPHCRLQGSPGFRHTHTHLLPPPLP